MKHVPRVINLLFVPNLRILLSSLYIEHCKSFFRPPYEFASKTTIVAWEHLYDYVEKYRTPRVVHREIFAFLFDHYQSFSQWQWNCL